MTASPVTTTPWRRTTEEIAAGIASWARSWRGARAMVSDVRAPGSGMANDTLLFRLDGDALVARLAPAADSPYPTFPTFDLDLQRQAMELVRRRTTVPVPEVVHLEESASWLGSPFLVTRALEGEVASDSPQYLMDPTGWFLQGTPEQWQRFERATIELLVQLHQIHDHGEETAFLHPPTSGDTALARHLASMHDYYQWAREGQRIPILERAHEVLVRTMPTNERSVVNWGDGRPGNILYREFEPVGALDWEMAGVGPPELDVAWLTFFQRFWEFMAGQYGLQLPTMFERDATAVAYEAMGGVALDDLTWYEAAAAFRFGIILYRMSHRSIAFGQQQPPANIDEHIMFVPLMEQLLEAIEQS